jgi:penicillin-binding protein 2
VRAKHANSEALAQNGWFVGFTPRRNPDIIVCVLFEGGEHGRLAARLATQVIKAYVDKQRKPPTKVAGENKKLEVGAVWNGDDDDLHGGHFVVDAVNKRLPMAATAPGLQSSGLSMSTQASR